MSSYSLTKSRAFQYVGILVVLGLLAVGYWYFSVRASTTVQNSQNGNLTTGLVGVWSFDGADISGTTAYDRSGNANNGTLTNGPAVAPGRIGQALNFDGTDDYVEIAPVAGLPAFSDTTHSVAFWVKGAANQVDNRVYAEGNDSVGTPLFSLGTAEGGDSGKLDVYIRDDSNTVLLNHIQTTANVFDGAWHHVVWADNNGAAKVYVDGILDMTDFTYTRSTLTLNVTAVGAIVRTGVQDWLSGSIDEVRAYNRVLSAAEVAGLYDMGKVKVGTRPGDEVLEEGLAGYWKLDENTGTSAADASGNANTGTLTNGPTWTTGRIGTGVDFDGTDDYVTVADSDALDADTGDSITLTAWINPDTTAPNYQTILTKGATAGSNSANYQLLLNDDGTLSLGFSDTNTIWNSYDTVDGTVTTGSWQFVAVQLTFGGGTASGKIYYNGVVQEVAVGAGTPGTNDPNVNSESLWIGAQNEVGGGAIDAPFNGKLDEIRLYNRLLSPEEVALLYRETHPDDPDTHLVGHWTFDGMDVSGTTATDRGRGGNTGTLTNGPVVTPGRIGQALSFNGVNQSVNMGTSAAFDNLVTKTVSAWIRPTGLTEYRGIMGRSTWALQICSNDATDCNGTTGHLVYYHAFSGTDGKWILGPNSVVANEWAHVVVTYDRSSTSNDPQIFVNGVAQTVTEISTPTGTANSETSDLSIGLDGYVYASGIIDDVRLYNAVLTQDQVTDIYRAAGGKAIVASSGNDTLRSGLVGLWSMDGQDVAWQDTTTEVKDDSGNANHGDATNMSTASAVPGRIGQALNFDATNDFINVGDPVALRDIEDQGGGGMSISVWIKPRSAGDRGHIVGKSNNDSGAGDGNWGLSLIDTSNRISFGHSRATQPISAYLNNGWVANQWQHVVVTFNGGTTASTAIQFYIDGALDATHDYDQDGAGAYVSDAGNDFLIGSGYISGSTYVFDGAIDDVRVYNRVITAAEVTQLYNLGR